MKQFSKDLGNVSLAPKGRWSKEQEYERLNLVYNDCDNLSYVAKIDVPIGVEIDNREYWQPMNATGYADNNFINLTTESETGTVTAYESLEEAVATILPINRRAGATLSFYNLNADRLDRQAEFELWQFNSTDLANWENRDYWNNIYYNWNVFAGWYVGADGLKNHVKIPNVGQYAYVGTNLNDALLYQCRTNGTWTNTGIKVRNYISVVVSGNITIGENGNWFSNGKDTGIPATPSVDEQLDNIIMQLQQHATEIDKLKKQDVVLKSNIDSNFETINNKVDEIKIATDNKIDTADANLQNQITSNDTDIATLNTKHESLSRTVQGIAATGGASTATNVTYNNDNSGLNAENAQDAIDELQGSKIDKTSILQELGGAEDKVMSQKAVSAKLSDLSNVSTELTDALAKTKSSCTNIIDPSKLIIGLLYNDGEHSSSELYRNTDYIPVNGQSVRIKNPANLSNNTYPNWCVYDSSKQFLRCAQSDSEPYDYQSGDYYIKICFNTSDTISPKFAYACYGTELLEAEEYFEGEKKVYYDLGKIEDDIDAQSASLDSAKKELSSHDSILLKETKSSCTNIIDPSKLIIGLLYNDGEHSSSELYRNTDYIPVNGQSVRIKNPANLSNNTYPNWCVYDSSKQFLRCAQSDSEPYDYQSGDYYIKICFNTSDTISPKFAYACYGTELLEAEEYFEGEKKVYYDLGKIEDDIDAQSASLDSAKKELSSHDSILLKETKSSCTNIIDPSKLIIGLLYNDGEHSSSELYRNTDYIPVNGQSVRIKNPANLSNNTYPNWCVYDSSKQFLRCAQSDSEPYDYQSGDYYIKICFNTSDTISPKFAYACYGTELLEAEEYFEGEKKVYYDLGKIEDDIDAQSASLDSAKKELSSHDSILLKETKSSCTNIIDPSKLIIGLLYNDGEHSSSELYRNTDYIPVNGQSVRIKNPANLSNNTYPNWCVYDSSKQFLRCAQSDSEPYDYQSGDYYIKICFNTSDTISPKFAYACYGTELLEAEEYFEGEKKVYYDLGKMEDFSLVEVGRTKLAIDFSKSGSISSSIRFTNYLEYDGVYSILINSESNIMPQSVTLRDSVGNVIKAFNTINIAIGVPLSFTVKHKNISQLFLQYTVIDKDISKPNAEIGLILYKGNNVRSISDNGNVNAFDELSNNTFDFTFVTKDFHCKEAIDNRIKEINKFNLSASSISDSFIFLTDTHYTRGDQGATPFYINKIFRNTLCRKLIFGGDANGDNAGQENDMMKSLYTHLKWMNDFKRFSDSVYQLRGNHDWTDFRNLNWGQDAVKNIFMSNLPTNAVVNNKTNGCYYYFDEPRCKTRYLCWDTNENGDGISEEQLSWFYNNALKTLWDGWYIVFMSHIPSCKICEGNDAEEAGYNKNPLRYLIKAINGRKNINMNGIALNFENVKYKVNAHIFGHIHRQVQTIINGVAYIGVGCNVFEYSMKESMMSEGYNSSYDGWHNGSFDVIQLDNTNNLIKATSIGRGNVRVFHLLPKTLSIGHTLQIDKADGDIFYSMNANGTPFNNFNVVDNDIVEVNESGLVSAIKAGDANIVVVHTDGSRDFYDFIVK